MFEHYAELTIGTDVYQERAYVGPVHFKVVKDHSHTKRLQAIEPKGYDFDLTEEIFAHYTISETPFHKSKEEALAHRKQLEDEFVFHYVQTYKHHKEAFVREMTQLAYDKEIDGEYGHYATAQAIKKLSEIHFPSQPID